LRRYFCCLVLVLLGFVKTLSADSGMDHALTTTVARKTLQEVMMAIAKDIEELQGDFPQLKKWNDAEISPEGIYYQYHYTAGRYPFAEEEFGKNGCHLAIDTKDQLQASASPQILGELKLGIYLKFKAVGKDAEELKRLIQEIVAKRFEMIRNLNS